jgi:carnitine 3-dehydrogenase
MDNLAFSDSLETACEGVFLVQESAPENLELKRALHAQIDAAAAPETIIASSSSGLLPSDIQSATQHPERMLIGHPFNPVYLLPLVELVGGEQTAPQTIDTAKAFYASLGMQPLVVRKEIEGYLSDRLQEALWREALHLVNDDIATTAELDAAIIYGPGLRWAFMGTCLTFHLAGGESGMRHMLEQFGPALKLPWTKLQAPELTEGLIDKMVSGTAEQAGAQTIEDLETLRDQCLIDIMQPLGRHQQARRLRWQSRSSATLQRLAQPSGSILRAHCVLAARQNARRSSKFTPPSSIILWSLSKVLTSRRPSRWILQCSLARWMYRTRCTKP